MYLFHGGCSHQSSPCFSCNSNCNNRNAVRVTNTICVVTVLIETGMVPVEEPVTKLLLETPAGLIAVDAQVHQGKVTRVTFRNVPAFAIHLDANIEVKGLGTVTVDVAWGGMFYVLADAGRFGLGLTPNEAGETARIAEMIKVAAQEQLPVRHPENPEMRGITICHIRDGKIVAGWDSWDARSLHRQLGLT